MHPLSRFPIMAAWACLLICVSALTCTVTSCNRQTVEASARHEQPAPNAEQPAPTPPEQRMKKVDVEPNSHPTEVLASWYEVPLLSVAKRRAGLEEFTAAHDRLPIGTLVRVTHLENGKSVRVRITDRGIHDRRVKLDLCKEAAEELGMLEKGIARVRIEVLEPSGGSPADKPTVAAQP